jgi:hypothetical protein
MGRLKPIGSEKLKGDDKIKRIIEIAQYRNVEKNNEYHTSTKSFSKKGADGRMYAIVQERDGYYVKSGINESKLDYINGLQNKRKDRFKSYGAALKRMNLIFKPLNEQYNDGKAIPMYEFKEFDEQEKFVLNVPDEEGDEEVDMDLDMDMGGEDDEMDVDMEDEMGDEEMDVDMETDVEGEEPDMEGFMKSIQKLTGKLGQKLRDVEEEMGDEEIDIETEMGDEEEIPMESIKKDKSIISEQGMMKALLRAIASITKDIQRRIVRGKKDLTPEQLTTLTMLIGLPPASLTALGVGMSTLKMWKGIVKAKGQYEAYKKLSDTTGETTPSVSSGDDEDVAMESLKNRVSNLLESYIEKKTENFDPKEFITNKLNENIRKKQATINSTSVEQEMKAHKFIKENKDFKFSGKTKKGSLVFSSANKKVVINTQGVIK